MFVTLEEINSFLDEAKISAPSNSVLEQLLYLLERRITVWLGYYPGLKEYCDRLTVQFNGAVLLQNYPVHSLLRVQFVQGQHVFDKPVTEFCRVGTVGVWKGGRTVEFSLSQGTKVEVQYNAGHDPLPEEFKVATKLLLKRTLESENGIYGDISWTNQPVRDISSVSLPGGVSQSYQLGKPIQKIVGEGTEFDRIVNPLLFRYKRRLLL